MPIRRLAGFFALFICLIAGVKAQPNILIFNDDFTNGSGNWALNGAGVGANNGSNQWIVNNQYNGAPLYPTTTDQNSTVSGTISFPNTNYLHIHDVPNAGVVANANFNPANASDRLAILNAGICTMGFTNVRFSFFYLVEGGAQGYGQLYFSRNNGAWQQIGQPQYNNQTLWKYEILTNPQFNNANDLRFAFRWVNTGGGPANMSFAVDDIFVLGDYDLTNPVTISITNVPAQVCQGTNLVFSFALSDTLCDGQYSIQLLNPVGVVVNTWAFNMYYPQTTATLAINISATTPIGVCYKIRVNRVSPPPQITGILSVCFNIVACPNTITTLQPVVTIGSEAPNGIGVCVGSVIDVPFWSTGSFFPGNQYIAQLSDVNGNFGAPQTIGSFMSQQAYDPTVTPNPGNVSGIIPPTADGCNYYIRVISTGPGTIGTVWGPFCIKNCDIETNNHQDIHFCISSTLGDTTTITYDINTPPVVGVTYGPGNQFLVEVLNSQTFAQVNIGVIGSVTSTTSGTIQINIPPLPGLLALGMQPGMYYIRVVATNSSAPNNALGSLIRMTIGAPYDGPNPIIATNNTICWNTGAIVFFYLQVYNPQSTYQWFLNGNPFPNYPTYPLGVQFNGAPGYYIFTVQETNFGCVGPMSPPDTVTMITAPNANISGPLNVCFGDTNQYSVSFIPNTAYGWSLNPPGAGSILINGADEITIAWDQVPSGVVTLTLDYATNQCGAATGSIQININPSPTANAGTDQTICAGETVQIGGSPTATGGTPGYTYQWTPAAGLAPPGAANPSASPLTTTSYIVRVLDTKNCDDRDTVLVTVNPLPTFTMSDTGFCDGIPFALDAGNPGATYDWNTGASTQVIPVTTSGSYSVTVTMATGCQDSERVDVEVWPLPDAVWNHELPCLVNPVVFHNQSTINGSTINDNLWTFGDGTGVNQFEPTHVFPAAGPYNVNLTVVTSDGCIDSLMQVVNVLPPAAQPALFPDTVCQGQASTLMGIPAPGTEVWWFSTQTDSVPLFVGNVFNVPPLSGTTTFWVQPVEPGGCPGVRVPIDVGVRPIPSGEIFADPRTAELPNGIISFQFVLHTPSPIASYLWEFGDGTISTLQNPVHQYNESGVYDIVLHLVDIYGCEYTITYKEYILIEKNIRIYVPNTFSPNGDGLNDFFNLSTRLVTHLHIRIYDRWGMLLFESNDLNFQWPGTDLKGQPLPEGAYVYQIDAQGFDGSPLDMAGSITLIR